MNFDGFIPHEFTRFGGLVDNDDPTVLPMGVAAVCRNCRFQLTTVATRYGLQTALQGPNQAGISGLAGLIYTPENPGETLFQVPMVFDTDGFLLVEKPAGSGILVRVQGPLVSQPSSAHAIITEAYNRALIAFSDLKAPLAPINVYGLSTQQLDPYGQKPLGAAWIASTSYLTGEYVQPTATGGNGHLYRCIVAGTTASAEPAWPLPENSTVTDGGVTWEEQTPVLVNRLPAPNGPQPTRMASGGAFAAGRDVYLEMTYVNAQGESIASTPSILVNTNLNDAATFTVPALSSLAGWIRGLASPYQPASVNVYEADVATSTAAPSSASFALVGNFALGSTVTVTTTAAGVAPPSANTARVTPGGLQPPPAPTVERASGSGSWAAGRDVYILASFTNAAGETLPSIAGTLIDTVVDDAIQVPIPSTLYQITGVNLYEADVPTGAAAPASSSYALVGGFQPLSTATITAPASGPPPPVVNSSGSAGTVAPGVRYASLAFTNRNGNLGPTVAAFTSVDVDVPGDQLYMANIPIGPANIINRTIGFTVADGTNVGPFFYIPAATVSAGIPMTATVIGDNSTTTAFFNFTDQFLEAETSTDMTDRLRCVLPPAAVDVYYSPSNDRVVLSGVDGYASGHYISLAADSESYYGDTSPIQVANGNGQRCICAREFQGTLFSLKERSGFTISPTATDPSTWSVQQRWEGVGPCGPRAVCVTNEFLFFVHRSGAYAYAPSEPEPKLMTKEIPTIWSTINWDYQHLIWCCVDEENKEIRIGIPVGNATVPNQTLTMNYMEGLSGPIHFSQYAGREVAMGAARKWSLDDVAGSVAVRCERRLPENASLFGALRQSQVLIGSSSPDGTVQMIATGIYNDNGSGIECQYETTSTQDLMEVSMLGGVSINALGQGSMTVSVMVARSYANSSQPGANEIKLAPFPLTPENWKGYDGGARGQNERFRMRFTNGTAPNAWFALKYCSLFTRPLFTARTGNGA
jgi:hypothetical protein